MKFRIFSSRFGSIRVEAEDDAGDDLHAVLVDDAHRIEDRHDHVVALVDLDQRVGLWRLDPTEDRVEGGLAHQGQDVGRAGDVERRLAGEVQRVAVPLLPGDEVRQQLLDGLPVADDVVVDEIDRPVDAELEQLVELGADALRALQARHAAVEAGNVAELALDRGNPLENWTVPSM